MQSFTIKVSHSKDVAEVVLFSLVVWGAEILLLRISGEAIKISDLILSLLFYLVPTVTIAGLLSLLVHQVLGRYLIWHIGGLALAFLSISLPLHGVITDQDELVDLLSIICFGGVALLISFLVAQFPKDRLIAMASASTIILAVSVILTWYYRIDNFPPNALVTSIILSWFILVLSTRKYRYLLCYLVLISIFSTIPGKLPFQPIHWFSSASRSGGPDIVLIVVDTLREDAARKMETYQLLQKQGVAHLQTQSPSPWTLPATASIFTGEPAHIHGAGIKDEGVFSRMDSNIKTLPERLSALGYDCVAVVSENSYLSKRYGFSNGFAVYDQVGDFEMRYALPARDYFEVRPAAILAGLAFLNQDSSPSVWRIIDSSHGRDAHALVNRALRFTAQRREEHPLFLFIHILDPHHPYYHIYDEDLPDEVKRILPFKISLRERPEWAGPKARDMIWRAYMNEVSVVDRALMRFFREIGPAGPNGRVVVFTSDHGEEFFEHDGIGHGHSFFQELLHVPLVTTGLSPTNLLGRTKKNQVVGTIDIAPALLEAAGGTLIKKKRSEYVSQNPLYSPVPACNMGRNPNGWAVRQDNLKVVVEEKTPKLYALDRDPKEQNDLAKDAKKILANMLSRKPPDFVNQNEKEHSAHNIELSPLEIQRLRALGYLEENEKQD